MLHWLPQWDVKKEEALSRIVEQRMNKEAVSFAPGNA